MIDPKLPSLPETPSIRAARELGRMAHEGQTRKGSSKPYTSHTERVAQRLVALGCNDDHTVCTAVLHDGPEDHPERLSIKDIADHPLLGPSVAATVAWFTKTQDQTRRTYTEGFRKANATACLVKLADRLDNLQDGFTHEPSRERSYNEESLLLLACIVSNSRMHSLVSPYKEAYLVLVRDLYRHIGRVLEWT